MGVRLQDLGPAAQRQVIEKLRQLDKQQKKARAGPATDEGSKLEQEYYTAFIWPKELAGEIDHVERHVRFELLPKAEYCGVSLPAAHYTPDFLIYYKSGDVEAVEVKHEAIRKNQRDYIYRRRLFIDNIVRAYDVGEDGDIKYIVNEYIHGDTLKKTIALYQRLNRNKNIELPVSCPFRNLRLGNFRVTFLRVIKHHLISRIRHAQIQITFLTHEIHPCRHQITGHGPDSVR